MCLKIPIYIVTYTWISKPLKQQGHGYNLTCPARQVEESNNNNEMSSLSKISMEAVSPPKQLL